jgi:hypothetical protein
MHSYQLVITKISGSLHHVFALKHLARRRRVCVCTYKYVVVLYDACGGKSGGQLARE